MGTEHLTVKDIAAELDISVDQAKKLIFEGQVPAIDVGVHSRSFWRVSRQDFDKWQAEQRAATARRFG